MLNHVPLLSAQGIATHSYYNTGLVTSHRGGLIRPGVFSKIQITAALIIATHGGVRPGRGANIKNPDEPNSAFLF